jgi:hypothetical protein
MKGGGACTTQLKKKMHCTATLKEGGKKASKKAPKKSKKKMAENEFYSVKDKKKIMVDKESIRAESKKMKNGKRSYMLRSGDKLVKFVSKEVHDKYS